jgi:CubicO group peptidase (beta-lactamase class C family)
VVSGGGHRAGVVAAEWKERVVGAGLSVERLERMRGTLERQVAGGATPGLVAAVVRGGAERVEVLGTGGDGEPALRRDSIFRVSSMTKPVTAVAAMILVEECVLRLDDPVDGLLPELAARRVVARLDGPVGETVPAERAITLRDLLTFRMGFGQLMASPADCPVLAAAVAAGIGMGPPEPDAMPAPDEWLRRLGELPLMCQPGERWLYNTGSDVLGVLIARASGQPFGDFLRERIFEPLGMRDTGFSVPAASADRFTPCWWTDPRTGRAALYDPATGGAWTRPPAFESGGAGLVSTVDDYLAFGRMVLANGRYPGGRLLSRPAVATMTTDHLTAAQKARSGFGAGYFDNRGWGFGGSVVTARDGLAGSVGRYGWDGGMGSSWYVDPAEGMITVLMTPRAWESPALPPLFRDFETSAYQAIDD